MDKDKPGCIYVVSDLHLGGRGACPNEFTAFIQWLRSIPDTGICPATLFTLRKGETRHTGEVSFRRPEKLILLGDVLDMWDPLDQDRSHVVKDAVGPLSCLHGFPGELIYVSGNHDMDIDEIRKTLDGKFYWGCKPGSTPNFEMYRGHYPATEKRRRAGEETEETVLPGIFVGDTKYSFIHGHQLDPEQIQYQIGEITQSRFDPVDAITDLANVSFIKEMRPQLLWAVATGWIVSLLLLFGLQNPVLKAVFTTILVVLSLLYLSLYSKDAEKVIQDRKFSGVEEGVIRLLFVNGYQAALILMFIPDFATFT
jgi:predicted phosphodiesterase